MKGHTFSWRNSLLILCGYNASTQGAVKGNVHLLTSDGRIRKELFGLYLFTTPTSFFWNRTSLFLLVQTRDLRTNRRGSLRSEM